MSASTWLKNGCRVESGDTADDYDAGIVTSIEGGSAFVEWDSLVGNWAPLSTLRPIGTDVPCTRGDWGCE